MWSAGQVVPCGWWMFWQDGGGYLAAWFVCDLIMNLFEFSYDSLSALPPREQNNPSRYVDQIGIAAPPSS